MFVYYKLYRKPASPTILTPRCGDQGKTAVSGIEVVHENAIKRSSSLPLEQRPLSLLAYRYSTSQLLLLQPQQTPHKHETKVANPQYLLHWH